MCLCKPSAIQLKMFVIRSAMVMSGADERGTRSSEITLDATTTRRTLEPSFRVSSAADTLLTSGDAHVDTFSC